VDRIGRTRTVPECRNERENETFRRARVWHARAAPGRFLRFRSQGYISFVRRVFWFSVKRSADEFRQEKHNRRRAINRIIDSVAKIENNFSFLT